MKLNPAKLLFLLTLVGSTMISVSSTSWFGAWIGLEINLLSFIPIMGNDMNQRSTEASLKYFLTQALGSIILILGTILLFYSLKLMNPFILKTLMTTFISSSLLLKLGAAPFHFWFPVVMEGLSWYNVIILMSWQKLAPLVLIYYLMNTSSTLILVFIICSTITGGIGGLNQTTLRKIMAYSSINHLSWIMAAMMTSKMLWMFYYASYILLSSAVILFFISINIFHINQIYDSIKLSKSNKIIFSLSLLSLGGLPPFAGFMPKLLIMQNMTNNMSLLVMIVMLMSALMTLYYYLRIIYLSFNITFSSKKHDLSSDRRKPGRFMLITLNFISVMSFCILLIMSSFIPF